MRNHRVRNGVPESGAYLLLMKLCCNVGLLPNQLFTQLRSSKNGIELSPAAVAQAHGLAEAGLDGLPVCIAKTHLSLSHDPSLGGTPGGFTLPVRELRPYTGAGWIVALCGDMQTMPGLPAEPAAKRIDVDADGRVTGLR